MFIVFQRETPSLENLAKESPRFHSYFLASLENMCIDFIESMRPLTRTRGG